MRPGMSAATVAALLLAASPLAGQEQPSKTRFTVEKTLDWERVSDPQIAPDGSRIVYTRQWVDRKTDRWVSDLMVLEDDARRERHLERGYSPRFSPDGTRLAAVTAEGVVLYAVSEDADTP